MLFKTTKIDHDHIAYLRKDGNGETSFDKEHFHLISKDGIEDSNGHNHQLDRPIPTKDIFKDESEDDLSVAIDTVRLWKISKDMDKENIDKAKESDKFYGSDQWKKTTREKLEGQDRAALTINEIESKIDFLSGYERQTRTDLRFFPVEGGDQKVADILTVLAKNITEQNDWEFERTEVFEDVLIAGRGFYNVYVSYDDNPEGDIIVEQYAWNGCTLGPHKRKSTKDCEYLTKHRWYSISDVKGMYPEKADKIDRMITELNEDIENPDDMAEHHTKPGEQYVLSDNKIPASWRGDLLNISDKRIRVLEQWRKIYRGVHIIANAGDDFYLRADGWTKEDLARVRTISGMRIIPKKLTKIRIVTVAGDVLLDDQKPAELAKDDFHIITIYAKKRGNKWWGRIEGVKGMQREINKRHSQLIDILNKVATYGWFIEPDTFSKASEKEKFEKNSSSPGFIAEVNDLDKTPKQVEGVKFPVEIVQTILLDYNKMSSLMGLDPAIFNLEKKTKQPESGIALIEKRRQGLVGNEFAFDNMALGDRKLGRLLVAMIQKHYTVKRMMRILDYQATREQFEVGGEPYVPEMPEEIAQIQDPVQRQVAYQKIINARKELLEGLLNNADLTKYDVVTGETVHSPTTKHANFIIWAELAKAGFPVPPLLLVDLSDLPEKEKAKKAIVGEMQRQSEQEKMKYDIELLKTLIAKDKTGDVTPGEGAQ
jgi:hypothetical protein